MPTRTHGVRSALLAGLLAAGVALAPLSPSAGGSDNARVLFGLADIGSGARELAGSLAERADEYEGGLPPASLARLRAAAREVADKRRATEIALAAFERCYDAAAAAAVEAWYRSEAGRRILAMEVTAAAADWDREMSPFVDSMNGKTTPLERVKVLERLAAATGAGPDAVAIQVAIARILGSGSRALLPDPRTAGGSETGAGLASLQGEPLQQMRRQLSIVFLFVYRDARQQELTLYADFAETSAASWLFEASRLSTGAVARWLEAELVAQLESSGAGR